MAGWTALWLDKNVDIKPWFGVYTSFLAVCALVSVLAPSKETIYLIAGSQAGEYVVNTPEAQEILTDIHQIIRLQLQQMQGEE